MPVGHHKQGKVGELRHGVLGSGDAIAQSLALLALTFAVSAAPVSAAVTAGAAVPVAYVIAGIGSLCLASVIVRFTRRVAHAGGLYTYTVRGLGPQVGFLAGWLYAIAFAVGISFVLIISADFLSGVLSTNTSVHLGWFPLYCILLSLILLIALTDIRISTRVQLVFAGHPRVYRIHRLRGSRRSRRGSRQAAPCDPQGHPRHCHS